MEETPYKEVIMKDKMRELLEKARENQLLLTTVGCVLATLGGIVALKEANDRTIVGVRTGTWDEDGRKLIAVKTKSDVKVYTRKTD